MIIIIAIAIISIIIDIVIICCYYFWVLLLCKFPILHNIYPIVYVADEFFFCSVFIASSLLTNAACFASIVAESSTHPLDTI